MINKSRTVITKSDIRSDMRAKRNALSSEFKLDAANKCCENIIKSKILPAAYPPLLTDPIIYNYCLVYF